MASKKKESGLHAFLRQYQDFMQVILIAAAILSLIVIRELGMTLMLPIGLTYLNPHLAGVNLLLVVVVDAGVHEIWHRRRAKWAHELGPRGEDMRYMGFSPVDMLLIRSERNINSNNTI